jgi:hypothetical protein
LKEKEATIATNAIENQMSCLKKMIFCDAGVPAATAL